MHFQVQTQALKAAIDAVSHASAPSAAAPILENILLSVQFNKIVLTANNLEMAVEYVLEKNVKILKEGAFTVSSRFLSSYIALAKDDSVEIELVGHGTLLFKTASGETKFKGLPADEFPVIPSIRKEQSFRLSGKDLKAAFEKTLFSTAQGTIRPTLAGVYVALAEKEVTFASTDSFRLSEFVLPHGANVAKPVSIIIPTRTAQELSKLVPEDATAEIFISDKQLLAVVNDVRVFSRLLSGHFPDYRAFFPKSHRTRGVVLRSEMIHALKQVSLISRENNYNTRLQFAAETGMTLDTGDTEVGAGKVRVKATVEGENATIGINSTYLIDALNVIRENYVSVDFETPLSPIMVRASDAKETAGAYRHIIMPLKI